MRAIVWPALTVNAVLVWTIRKTKSLSMYGAIVTGLMGLWFFLTLGWRGYLVPIAFLLLGNLCTRLGYEEKRQRGAAQSHEGIRGVREVLANGLVPLILSVMFYATGSKLLVVGYVGAWATALCDTTATELGVLWGRRCILVKSLRPVPPGTPGAVSLEGTITGFAAALVLVAVSSACGLVSIRLLFPIGAAAIIGSVAESYLASVIPAAYRYKHELLNLFNTSVGGGLALWCGAVLVNPR